MGLLFGTANYKMLHSQANIIIALDPPVGALRFDIAYYKKITTKLLEHCNT